MKKLLTILLLLPSLLYGQVTISTKRITSDTTKFNVLTTRPNAPTSGLKEYDWLKNLWTKDSLGVERRLLTHLDSIYKMQSIDFDTTNSTTSITGRLFWNATDGTLDLGMPNGVVQQIGQELFLRAVNKTGATITDGSLVYISGSQGNRPTIALAKANVDSMSHVVGMATQNILKNQEGYITIYGIVRGLNTSSFTEGDVLWLSTTTAGAYTKTEPSAPHHSSKIGIITNSHLNQGSILISISPHKALTELSDVNGTPLSKTGQILMWDNDNQYFDFNFNIIDSLAAIESRVLSNESMFQKDADSTISALYPLNISALRLMPDTRYVPFVLPNVNSLNGDTISLGAIISGEKILDVFGVADGAGGLKSKGIKVKGNVIASNINDTNWDYAFGWATATKEPTGWQNNTTSHLAFTNHNRTLTITGNYTTYYRGVPTARTGGSIQIANTTGMHYIYYNSSGVLAESTVFPGFDQILTAFVYWNATTGKGLLNFERHGITMDWKTHEYLHQTVSSRYASGMGATFGNTTFSIDAGEWYDEDIEHLTPTLTTATILYKNGDANWQWDTLQTNYMKMNGANIRYNNGNSLADVGSNNYVAYWLFVTSDSAHPYVSMLGQRTDPDIAAARANNTYTGLLLGNLPFTEMKLLYRVILRNDGTPYEETADYRTTNAVGNTAYVATSHSTLTGLTNDDHTQYILASGTRQLTANWDAKESINIATGELFTVNSDTLPLTNVKQFSSATLKNRITDETGSGVAVFATSPTLVTPILGTPQSGNFSTGTFTWPTFNQNTTGSAAKWTTARNLAGNSVDGSANVAFSNKFIVQGTTDSGLSGAQFLGSLASGLVKNTTTTGVLSIAQAGTDYQSPLSAGQLANINAGAVWSKGADSTINALYPANISSFRLLPDSRYTLGNLPVVNSLYGDTVSMNYVIGGKRAFSMFGVPDGAGGLSDYGINAVKGKFAGNLTLGSTLTIGGVTYTYPGSAGTNNYVLTTDGAGTLSWTDKTGGTAGYINSLNSSNVAAQTLVGTAPISVSTNTGTGAHTISMTQSNGSTNGYLSSTDWTTFNGKEAGGTMTSHLSAFNHDNIANGQTAYGWGNHAGLYTLIAHTGAGGTAHAEAIAGGAAGFLSGTDKTKLNNTSGTNSGDNAVNTTYAPLYRNFTLASDSVLYPNFPLGISSLRYEPDSRYVDNIPLYSSLYGAKIGKSIILGGRNVFEAWATSDGANGVLNSGVNVSGTVVADSLKVTWETGTGKLVRSTDAAMTRLTLAPGIDADPGAPLKFTDGTLMTDTKKGAMEFTGSTLYFTPGSDGSPRKRFAYTTDTLPTVSKWAVSRRLYGHWIDGAANMDSVITSEYGGTGVNNAGRTITIQTNSGTFNFLTSGKTATFNNSFSTAGDYALTLTQTGTTNVTLPTSGTLGTTAQIGAKLDTTNATYTNRLNWSTAYTDRLKWDGGSTGLNAATGRTSLGLGSAALQTAEYFSINTHVHGNISNDGKLGSTAGLPLITSAAGAIVAGSFGTGATDFAAGNHGHFGVYAPVNQQFYLGTTAVAINRTSGALTLNDVSISGNALTATNADTANISKKVVLADESTDQTCFPVFSATATGNQPLLTRAGSLTYNSNTGVLSSANVAVNDEAYGAGWDGSYNVPTKNAIYDKIQALGTGVQTTYKDITLDSLRYIHYSQPITVVAAPGSGYAIEVISCAIKWSKTGAWTSNGGTLNLCTNLGYAQFYFPNRWASTTTIIDKGRQPTESTSGDLIENRPLFAYVSSVNPTSDSGTYGTSVACRIYVTYRIITL